MILLRQVVTIPAAAKSLSSALGLKLSEDALSSAPATPVRMHVTQSNVPSSKGKDTMSPS